ncbi:unnamed protein product [Adineta steineri]|uniref:Tetraspanin n=2 Tax=Adineta steineri TaxID=433720 RepID=A0A818J2S4_9BILA|nr:unnamed protein product [Adineta steineri]
MALGRGHGSMSLSMKFLRLLIVLFNMAFIVIGLAVLAIGVYCIKDPQMQTIGSFLNPNLTSTYSQSFANFKAFAIALVAIGGVLLFIGFLGCCGSIKGFRFLHVMYAVILGLIIIAEVALVIVFLAYQQQFRAKTIPKLQNAIATYYVGTPIDNTTVVNSVSLSWDFAQFNLQCCGAVGPSDFVAAKNWTRTNPYPPAAPLLVPFTCCPLGAAKSWTQLPTNLSSAANCAATSSGAYTVGCYDRLVSILATYKNYAMIVGIIVGVIEVLALVFALLLFRRKEDYDTL